VFVRVTAIKTNVYHKYKHIAK